MPRARAHQRPGNSHPQTVILSFATAPTGLQLGGERDVVDRAVHARGHQGLDELALARPPRRRSARRRTQFTSWSDGGGSLTHRSLPTPRATYTATFAATGSSTTLIPVADAEIRSNKPTKNFGTLPTLVGPERGAAELPAVQRPDPERDGYRCAGCGSSSWRASTAGGSVFTVGNSWTETGITWNNAPPISGNSLGTAGAATVGTWVEFDVTSAIASGNPVSFAVSGGNTNAVDYSSRSGTQSPQLVITTAP